MVKSAQQPRAEDTAGAMQIKMGLNRIKRQTVQQSLSGQISRDPGAGAEAEVEEKDGNYIVKDVQKDMIYLIRGEWGNGWVEFGFDVG